MSLAPRSASQNSASHEPYGSLFMLCGSSSKSSFILSTVPLIGAEISPNALERLGVADDLAGLIIFVLVAEVEKRYLPALLRHEVGYPDPRRAVGHEIDPLMRGGVK